MCTQILNLDISSIGPVSIIKLNELCKPSHYASQPRHGPRHVTRVLHVSDTCSQYSRDCGCTIITYFRVKSNVLIS